MAGRCAQQDVVLKRFVASAAVAICLGFAAPAVAQRAPSAPEAATGLTPKTVATATRHMVSAANPLAVEAGLAMLDAGGSAMDAAIAVQLVLNLVEPQSSGLGGGAFLLHYDVGRRLLRSYDGRETAPKAIQPNVFLKPDGNPRAFNEAVFGGQSVGVPGLARLMETAHKRYGKLPWKRLFEPALKLARDGFAMSPRLNGLLTQMGAQNFDATARAYFFDSEGKAWPVGHILKNPAFTATLQTLADKGAVSLYRGPIADGLVDTVTKAATHQGQLTAADMTAYQAKERPAVCTTYRKHRVCGMGPPSSGGIAVAQMLALLEPFDLGKTPMAPNALHLIAEAQKLAYADRDRYVGDPDQVKVPAGLTDKAYLAARRAWIDPIKAKPKAEPGEPPGLDGKRAGVDATHESVGTSHISIIDRRGNAVSMTTTIENAFGARLMTGGFLLNNQLTDFSFRPVDAVGAAVANAVAPGKRPRSSMAPTIILDPSGRVMAVLGAPGGSRIPLYVAKSVIGLIDWGLDPQAAIDLPNFGSRNGPLELEKDAINLETTKAMADLGHQVQAVEMTSGLHAVVRRANGQLQGGADPRREGVAKGR